MLSVLASSTDFISKIKTLKPWIISRVSHPWEVHRLCQTIMYCSSIINHVVEHTWQVNKGCYINMLFMAKMAQNQDDLTLWNTFISSPIYEWWPAKTMTLQWRHNERDGVSNHQPHDYLLNRLFRRWSMKTSKLRVTGLCAGNSPVTGEFPAQRAISAENVSIWWRHHNIPHYTTTYQFYHKTCIWTHKYPNG